MSLTPLGSISLAAAVPLAATASAAIGVAVGASQGQVQAQIDGCIAAAADLTLNPPSLILDGNVAAQLVAAVAVEVAAGVVVPTLSAQLTAIADAQAILSAVLGLLSAQLAISANLDGVLAAGSVEAFAYDGAAEDLGAALTAQYAGDTSHCNALILLTKIGATWVAMSTLFRVTP